MLKSEEVNLWISRAYFSE